jgi:hypothetical protein
MNSGIVAERSVFTVENSVFRDLQPIQGSTYPLRGFGIIHHGNGHLLNQKGFGKQGIPSFFNVRYPIRSQGANLTSTDNRILDHVQIGIWTHLCKNRDIVIEENYIEADYRGLSLSGNDPVKSVSVINNEIRMVNQTNWIPQFAIALHETGMAPQGPAIYNDNILHNVHANTWAAFHSQGAVGHNIEQNIMTTNLDGLRVLDGNEVIVRYNEVSGPGEENGEGIRIESSPRSFVLCNDLFDFEKGLGYHQHNYANRVGFNTFHTEFTDALYYNPTGYTSPQINMQNTWCDNTVVQGGFEAIHEDPVYAELSEYMILSSAGECYSPDPVEPNAGWFRFYPALQTPITCPEYDRSRQGELHDLERLIAQDSLDNPEGAPAWLWILRSDLYQMLMEWPDTSWTGTDYEDFLADMDTSDVGLWYAVEQDIQDIMLSNTDLNILETNILDTTALWHSAIAVQMAIVWEPTSSVMDSLNAVLQIDTLIMELDAFASNWDDHRRFLDSMRQQSLLEMLSDVLSAPATEDWTEAMQIVWSAVLKIELFGPDTLNGTMVTDLDAIAIECPLTHGKAVYIAGSLLADIFNLNYTYECAPVQPLISSYNEVLPEQERLSMFPIPASDWLVLELPEGSPIGNVDIMHVSGSHVLSQRVSGHTVKLNVSHLPVGMYVLKWRPLNGHAVSSILSIQR